MSETKIQFMPSGAALPPNKAMRFKTKVLGRTTLKVLNENSKAGIVIVNGVNQFVPGAERFSMGVLDLSGLWYFGKTVIIVNGNDWVLRVEH